MYESESISTKDAEHWINLARLNPIDCVHCLLSKIRWLEEIVEHNAAHLDQYVYLAMEAEKRYFDLRQLVEKQNLLNNKKET